MPKLYKGTQIGRTLDFLLIFKTEKLCKKKLISFLTKKIFENKKQYLDVTLNKFLRIEKYKEIYTLV